MRPECLVPLRRSQDAPAREPLPFEFQFPLPLRFPRPDLLRLASQFGPLALDLGEFLLGFSGLGVDRFSHFAEHSTGRRRRGPGTRAPPAGAGECYAGQRMASSLNRATLLGNIGRAPERQTTSSGTKLLRFSVATTSSWKDRQGDWQETTEWHRVTVWNPPDHLDALGVGTRVYVEGQLRTRSWEADGVKRSSTEVVADRIINLAPRGAASPESENPPGRAPAPETAPDRAPAPETEPGDRWL